MFFFNLCFTQCSKLIGILVCKKENMLENQEQNTETCWAVQPKALHFEKARGWFHTVDLFTHTFSLILSCCPCQRPSHQLFSCTHWCCSRTGILTFDLVVEESKSSLSSSQSSSFLTSSPSLTSSCSVFIWGLGQMKTDVSGEWGSVYQQHL